MKHIILLFLLGGFMLPASAQRIIHSVGPNIAASNAGSAYYPLIAVSYTPRINLYEKEESSVSVGLPVNIGTIMFSGTGGMYLPSWEGYLVSVPAVITFNRGAGATRRFYKRTGFFAGAGMGYLYRKIYDDGFLNDTGHRSVINGPAATIHTGLRIGVGKKVPRYKHIELRLSFTMPLQKSNEHIAGFHLLFSRHK